MAKIYKLKIFNFRGIEEFEHVFGDQSLICLIGRGDAGKSTILKAISYVLSPSWNITILDNDFFEGNIENNIVIEATLINVPEAFLQEDKFGFQIRGLNKGTGEIHDELQDGHEKILTIRLTVDKDLEPTWEVVNDRYGDNQIIKYRDREKLNTFFIADYIDRHFSWNKGTLLNSLYKSIESDEGITEKNIIINALRTAKLEVDSNPFSHFDDAIEEIKKISSELGIELNNTQTTLDFKDVFIKDGKAYLHDGKVPFSLKGKGSRRLTSISIQMAIVKDGGIILIDEIEQGLEPDRVQHLVKTMKNKNLGQTFITTHSRDVLVELDAKDIFLMKVSENSMVNFTGELQGVIRSNPEAFFSERIFVCEGPTEIGIIRAIDDFRIQNGDKALSTLGVRYANGSGSSQIEYAKGFKNAGYDVCLFCDSDVREVNNKKEELKKLSINIVDSEEGNSIEDQMFNDLPWESLKSLVDYAISESSEESITDSFIASYKRIHSTEPHENWRNIDSPEIRKCLGIVSSKNGWYKRIDHGQVIGKIICNALNQMEGKRIKEEIENLSNWIDA